MTTRILHVVGRMDRGGVETWLMNVMRHIDRERFRMDFLVHTDEPSAHDDEIRSLGARIFSCPSPWYRQPRTYARSFKRILREQEPYDVIHSHIFFASGYVLRLAHQEGIPSRIAHGHTGGVDADRRNAARRMYETLTRYWIWRHATKGIGVSEGAATTLFGPRWKYDRRFEVVYYGFDFSSFNHLPSKAAVKAKLGIPPGRKVLGHIGRFLPVKNHEFLVRVFAKVVADGMDAHLLLVGKGPLEESVRAQLQKAGLLDRCTMTGEQANVAPFFGAMDLFVFPSHYEGSPVVTVEAQAAGVQALVSSSVTKEIDVIPSLIKRLEPGYGVDAWAQTAIWKLCTNPVFDDAPAVMVAQSRFGLQRCLDDLYRIYVVERV